MKNAAPENGVTDSPSAKRSKVEPEVEGEVVAVVNENVEEIEKVQQELHALDEICAKEQMQIQKKFDEKKKPYFEKRQLLIEKIPNFWADALANHPALSVLTEHDRPLLECLKRIELEDNLDDNGSYKITFVFTDDIKTYFEPTTLVKHVKFEENSEEVEECTKIQWKEGKNPQLEMKYSHEDEWSVFEWFSETVSDEKPDLGEVIRREIWHSPLSYFMGQRASYDDEDDLDDEDDEDEDEDEAGDDDTVAGDDDSAPKEGEGEVEVDQ